MCGIGAAWFHSVPQNVQPAGVAGANATHLGLADPHLAGGQRVHTQPACQQADRLPRLTAQQWIGHWRSRHAPELIGGARPQLAPYVLIGDLLRSTALKCCKLKLTATR